MPWDGASPGTTGHPAYSQEPPPQALRQREMSDIYAHHGRQDSNGTGAVTADTPVSAGMSVRRHPDYDANSIDGESIGSRSHRSKNPIPNPSVVIRSEYPTLTRSRQQQPLTCLVTVEMPEGKWRPDIDDLRSMRPRLSQTLDRNHKHVQSNVSNRSNKSLKQPQPLPEPMESAEELDRVTEELHSRVDNWHGLDFSR